jgi:hypothetical protein
MTTTVHTGPTTRTPATGGVPTDSLRKTALAAGTLYLITYVSSIPAVFVFLGPVLDNPDYILGAGADTRVLWGCLLDVVNALACIGTAVVLFPLLKRQNEAVALGFVSTRVLEAAVILVGVVSLLAVVTLRQDLAGGPDDGSLVAVGQSLVAIRNWTFLFGPGLMAALNALLLGYLLYRSRLVPRVIPLLGLAGAPLLIGSVLATLFGVHDQISASAMVAGLPIFVWELSLGLWLVVKGFTPSPLTTRAGAADTPPVPPGVTA